MNVSLVYNEQKWLLDELLILIRVMSFNTTFNDIYKVISRWSVLLVEDTRLFIHIAFTNLCINW